MPDEYLKYLMRAFALESRLAARAEVLAVAAKADAEPSLALVLKAQAASRQVRARRLLRLARGKISRGRGAVIQAAKTDQAGAASLYHGVSEDAPAGLRHSAKVERLMPGMLDRALEPSGPTLPNGYVVCQVCGFIKQGEAPERCPICGALKSKFESIE